jgi:hypothetical protein
MKTVSELVILLIAMMVGFGQQPARAQACQDEETMLKTSLKDVSDLVDSVKKENVSDFQNHYHQKSYLSKGIFLVSMVGGLVDCLEKAAQDATATKEQADSYKSKGESYAKLKSKVEQENKAVKSTDDAKGAKALIEKISLSS